MRNRVVVLFVGLFLMCFHVQSQIDIQAVDAPPAGRANTYYIGHREPLLASPIIKLPLTSIKPSGWILKQLQLQNNGFHGRLTEISAFLKKNGNGWLNPEGQGGRGWEEVPYWLKGFGDTGYILNDKRVIDEAKVWIEAAFASQREDGFFGPRSNLTGLNGKPDLWPNMIMLFALQSWYEYSQDKRVIDLMTRYFRWEMTIPEQDFLVPYWQQQRGADNLYSVYWLYNITGDKFLLDLAKKIFRHTANWTDAIPDWHNVNMSQAFDTPGIFYMQSRDLSHLAAAERNWQTIRNLYGQVPGGMFGGDENCRPGYVGPRQAIETCGMVEMMLSHETLLRISGNTLWADRCEDVAFNSLPAAFTPDYKALRYLTSPNMALSDRHNKSPGIQNDGPMFHYNPHSHRCCQHNFGHGWPYLIENLWQATPGNGLAAVLYAPCSVTAKVGDGTEVTIEESTRYPFEETIQLRLTLSKPVRFPLYLRIPGWCRKPTLQMNGENASISSDAKGYLVIRRQWRDGDHIRISFPMEISLRVWTRNKNSISIDRGPLTYSLKIGEQYLREGGTDAWPAWELHPTTPWNYGLLIDPANITDSFEFKRKAWPVSDQPFVPDDAPLELTAKARKIPEWQLDDQGLIGEIQDSPVRSTEPIETVTLIPMGAARLRISSFPTLGEGPDAHDWMIPKPSSEAASHVNPSDSVNAIRDGRIPASSADTTIPRFTWWDHRGTEEWIRYDLDKPAVLSSVEVYWFDDTGIGRCRVPASWEILYRDGDRWVPIGTSEPYEIAKDRFCRVNFKPIKTDSIRIAVRLQPGFSSGILEMRVN